MAWATPYYVHGGDPVSATGLLRTDVYDVLGSYAAATGQENVDVLTDFGPIGKVGSLHSVVLSDYQKQKLRDFRAHIQDALAYQQLVDAERKKGLGGRLWDNVTSGLSGVGRYLGMSSRKKDYGGRSGHRRPRVSRSRKSRSRSRKSKHAVKRHRRA